MSLLKNIKSLFVVDPSDGSSPDSRQTSTPKRAADEDLVSESPVGHIGKVDKRFADILVKAMQSANTEGFDYLEFKQSLRSLKDMEMDDGTRYKSAFAMAKTMGATPALLIESARFYISILKKEEAKFEKALDKQRQLKVLSREQELAALEAQLVEKEQMIEQLKQELKAGRAKVSTLKSAREEAAASMEDTRNDFIASYNTLVSQIKEDVENIKQYL